MADEKKVTSKVGIKEGIGKREGLMKGSCKVWGKSVKSQS